MLLQLNEAVARRHDLHRPALDRAAQRRSGGNAVPDRRVRALHRRRRDAGFRRAVIFAFEVERLARPCGGHQIERLLEALDAFGARHVMGGEFPADIARCDAEHEAPVREIVEHRDILGQFQRRIERHQENAGADAHMFGNRGGAGHGDQRRRAEAILLHMMRRLKRRAVAERLGARQTAQHIGIGFVPGNAAAGRILIGEQETEFHI